MSDLCAKCGKQPKSGNSKNCLDCKIEIMDGTKKTALDRKRDKVLSNRAELAVSMLAPLLKENISPHKVKSIMIEIIMRARVPISHDDLLGQYQETIYAERK